MSDGWPAAAGKVCGAWRRLEVGISWIEFSHLFSTFYFSLSTCSSAVRSIAWLDVFVCVTLRSACGRLPSRGIERTQRLEILARHHNQENDAKTHTSQEDNMEENKRMQTIADTTVSRIQPKSQQTGGDKRDAHQTLRPSNPCWKCSQA